MRAHFSLIYMLKKKLSRYRPGVALRMGRGIALHKRSVIPVVFIIKLDWSVCICLLQLQNAAERTALLEKRMNSKSKKIRQMFFYFWKEHQMPFYMNVF